MEYILKVALKYRRGIWRRISIGSHRTLHDLHEAIFRAFDRWDEHLYSFYLPSESAFRKGEGMDYSTSDWIEAGNPRVKPADRTTLASLHLPEGARFSYLFDFGDEWRHEITVEKLNATGKSRGEAQVLVTRGASPPQYPEEDEEE